MAKTHSRSKSSHRGPRHDADPDRRVKYTLRFQRRGDQVQAFTVLVRRGRRNDGKELAPEQTQTQVRASRRRERQREQATLGELTKQVNAADRPLSDAAGGPAGDVQDLSFPQDLPDADLIPGDGS